MKIALVTGGSKGIGRQIALDLSEKGYKVIATYNNTVVKEITPNLTYVKCDISDPLQVKKLFSNIESLDVLINNAGVSHVSLLQEMPIEDIASNIGVNLNGAIYCCKYGAKIMARQHSGVIVNISSVWGIVGASCETVYSASKGGLITLTKALAKELAPSGIRVNCIACGAVQTDMLNCFTENDIKVMIDETPLGRIGTVEDVSKSVQFLIGENSSFITGQTLTVDGGFSL